MLTRHSLLSNFLRNTVLGAMGTICLAAPLSYAATAQPGYPVPQIIGPTHPSAVVPGSLHFTLDVYGANFINGSTVTGMGARELLPSSPATTCALR